MYIIYLFKSLEIKLFLVYFSINLYLSKYPHDKYRGKTLELKLFCSNELGIFNFIRINKQVNNNTDINFA